MVIRSVGVGSVAKVSGALYAGLGLLIGACIAAVSLVGLGFAASQQDSDMPAWFGAVFGVGAIVFLPILYGVLGVVMGAITAALYNLVARMVGGVRIDVQ
jgi:hypothetical protein